MNWSREAELVILEGVSLDQLDVKIPAAVRAAILMAEQLRLKHEALSQLLTHFYEVLPQENMPIFASITDASGCLQASVSRLCCPHFVLIVWAYLRGRIYRESLKLLID